VVFCCIAALSALPALSSAASDPAAAPGTDTVTGESFPGNYHFNP